MTLKETIAKVRDAIKRGDLYGVFEQHDKPTSDMYKAFLDVCDAAESTLPQTKKMWTIEFDETLDGTVIHYHHDGDVFALSPYKDRKGAEGYVQSHLLRDPKVSNITIKEVDVEI